MMPESPTAEPTERSIPPEIMTNVSPIAMRTRGTQSEMIFPKTAFVRKMEFCDVKRPPSRKEQQAESPADCEGAL